MKMMSCSVNFRSPDNETMFVKTVKVCLTAVVTVLERQYDRYFAMDVSKKLEETESARCHNIDAEEIMGMFSAAKDNAPNATLNYLSWCYLMGILEGKVVRRDICHVWYNRDSKQKEMYSG